MSDEKSPLWGAPDGSVAPEPLAAPSRAVDSEDPDTTAVRSYSPAGDTGHTVDSAHAVDMVNTAPESSSSAAAASTDEPTTVLPPMDRARRLPPPVAPTEPVAAAGNPVPPPGRATARPPARSRRRARLSLRRIDPWSVFTTTLLLSLFLGIVLLVAVLALYGALDAAGVITSISKALATIGVLKEGTQLAGLGQVLLISAVLAAVNIVLVTLLVTLFAILYNLVASLTGGIQVTLSEGD